jgi:hypothetical protein
MTTKAKKIAGKKSQKKLALNKQTLRDLSPEGKEVKGGQRPPVTQGCYTHDYGYYCFGGLG